MAVSLWASSGTTASCRIESRRHASPVRGLQAPDRRRFRGRAHGGRRLRRRQPQAPVSGAVGDGYVGSVARMAGDDAASAPTGAPRPAGTRTGRSAQAPARCGRVTAKLTNTRTCRDSAQRRYRRGARSSCGPPEDAGVDDDPLLASPPSCGGARGRRSPAPASNRPQKSDHGGNGDTSQNATSCIKLRQPSQIRQQNQSITPIEMSCRRLGVTFRDARQCSHHRVMSS